jgi:hypothetical protein
MHDRGWIFGSPARKSREIRNEWYIVMTTGHNHRIVNAFIDALRGKRLCLDSPTGCCRGTRDGYVKHASFEGDHMPHVLSICFEVIQHNFAPREELCIRWKPKFGVLHQMMG